MTHLHFCRTRRMAGIAAGAIGIVLLASAGAQAFTFNDQSSAGSSNGTNFNDPADRTKSRMSGESSDRTTFRSGNTTLQFGSRGSADQRGGSQRYFTPERLMGR